MPRIFGLVVLAGFSLAAAPPPPPSPTPRPQALSARPQALSECLDQASAALAAWRAQGLADAETDRRYREAVAACASPEDSPAQVACAAAVNFDRARLARQLAAKKISPAQYLAALRDRTRKMERCRQPQFAAALADGDDDGDLVPNASDRCPGTPDLAPTDDRGCPSRAKLPKAASAEEVDRALKAFGFVASPLCEAAPVPETPTAILLGVILAPPPPVKESLEVTVSKVANQPAGCHVVYEVTVRGSSPTRASLPPTASVQFVFRDSENIETGPSAQTRQRFFVQFPGTSPLSYRNLQWRVRAMNGSGLVSGWSELKVGLAGTG